MSSGRAGQGAAAAGSSAGDAGREAGDAVCGGCAGRGAGASADRAGGAGRGTGTPGICALGERCCGCGACAAVCPKGCIEMRADALGFLRPEVDAAACVGCGMCGRVCPALNARPADGCEAVWWARAADDGFRLRSSSGGVFGLLARRVLEEGGAVWGAAFGDGCRSVRHVRVGSVEGLDAVMRSKYVQSPVGAEVYRGVERDLRAGLPVLFSGTACQVSGMRGYLGARRVPSEGLLLVDVICHGVPSPRLWGAWLEYCGGLAGAPVRCVNFRSKSSGWTIYSVAYEYATEQGEGRAESCAFAGDWYMRAFLANASLRGSCLRCPAKRSCGSDLTLGDFWGVRERHPEAFDDLGVSAVIANTARGASAVEALGDAIARGGSSFEAVLPGNPSLARPVAPHPGREAFLAAVADGGPMPDLMRRWPFEPPPRTLRDRVVGKLKHIAKRVTGRR